MLKAGLFMVMSSGRPQSMVCISVSNLPHKLGIGKMCCHKVVIGPFEALVKPFKLSSLFITFIETDPSPRKNCCHRRHREAKLDVVSSIVVTSEDLVIHRTVMSPFHPLV